MDRRDGKGSHPVDSRIAIYRGLRALVLVLVLGGLIKYGCLDIYPIATDQMTPTLRAGDRVVVLKGAYRGPLSPFLDPRAHHAVVFDHPAVDNTVGCLRIAGRPGEVVSVEEGVLHIDGMPRLGLSESAEECELLPREYSPRDWMAPFRLPRKGDSYSLDTLSHRDLVFVLAMMRQEYPDRNLVLRASLEVDGAAANDYIMADFALYKGRFDSIPDSLASQWFFWDRLEEFLDARESDTKVTLALGVSEDGNPVPRYTVGKAFHFLLAEQWCSGFDSRYFGPVCESAMRGRVACVLWSVGEEGSGRRFRTDRLFRFVK